MKSPAQPDLLAAPVAPLILRLALPSMAGMLAASLGSLFDALLLSRQNAQLSAAVSVSFSLLTLIQTIGFTLGMGAGGFVSRSLGRGQKPAAFSAASTAFFTALLFSVTLCGACVLFARPLVRLLGSTDSAAGPAAAYARYTLLTGPLLCASLVLSSLLRAQGRTLENMLAFTAGAAVGVPLEFLLVCRMRLDVHGAGISMFVRETVTLSILVAATLRAKLIRPKLRSFSPRLAVYRDIMRSGLPTLLRQGLMSVSAVLLTRASSALGEAALAGMGLCIRTVALITSAVIGFGQGFQPICGFAFGAGRMDRVQAAYRFSQRCVVITLIGVGAAVFALAQPLLSRFAPDQAVLHVAVSALRTQSAVLFAQGAIIMMNMLTQALGLTVRASLIATSRQGFVFIPLVLALPRLFGLAGLILCQSVSDLLSLLFCLVVVRPALRGSSCARGECSAVRTASR